MFSCVLAPPPCPPLFPYTTLFRSHRGKPKAELVARRSECVSRSAELKAASELGRGLSQSQRTECDELAAEMPTIDRKSTRLNSSHRCISYAVFCLKKKNNIISFCS